MVSIGDVTTWDTGCDIWKQAAKVTEEAIEVWLAVERDEGRGRVIEECADVIQSVCNLLAILGIDDCTPHMDACKKRNEERGRL